MIDLHTHIMFSIDDGAKTIEDSINLIKEEINNGFKSIVLTPHYVDNTKYNCNNKSKKQLLNKLKQAVKHLDINLYLGNEVYVSNNILSLLKEDKITTINNSKYMLIELPLNGNINSLTSILYELNSNNITPILAHPERYLSLQNNRKRINNLLDYDILFQGNLGSLVGLYGYKAKRTLKYLLKNNLIQIMATDTHIVNKINTKKALRKLNKIVGKNKANELLVINPQLVLEDKEI